MVTILMMIMTLVFLTFYPFNGFFSFQSLIVAYRCKLELWDDDKVENIKKNTFYLR